MELIDEIKLAENKNTSLEKLKELKLSENAFVRAAVAENPSIPLEWIIEFSKDENLLVVSSALNNASLPKSELNKILAKSRAKGFNNAPKAFTSDIDKIL